MKVGNGRDKKERKHGFLLGEAQTRSGPQELNVSMFQIMAPECKLPSSVMKKLFERSKEILYCLVLEGYGRDCKNPWGGSREKKQFIMLC